METPLKVEITNKGVIELYQELSWKLSSKWDPITAEKRIELLEQNCGVITHFAVEEVVKSKESKFMEGLANASHVLCLLYRISEDYKTAKKRQKVCESTIATSFPAELFYAALTYHYHEIAILLFRKHDYPRASKYIKKCLHRYEVFTNDKNKNRADVHHRMGYIHLYKKEKSEMRKHFEIAVKAWRGDAAYEKKVTEMAYHLGVSFMGEKKWKQAGEYLIEAEKLFEKQGNIEMIAKCYSFLSDIRKHEKLKDEAQRYAERAFQYTEILNKQHLAPSAPPVSPPTNRSPPPPSKPLPISPSKEKRRNSMSSLGPDTEPASHQPQMTPPMNPLKRSISFEAIDIQFEPLHPPQYTQYAPIPPYVGPQHPMTKSDTIN